MCSPRRSVTKSTEPRGAMGMADQEPGDGPDPQFGPGVSLAETSAEGIARLGRDKVDRRANPDDPLVASAESLTAAVVHLDRTVHSRSVGFLVALILIAALGIALGII